MTLRDAWDYVKNNAVDAGPPGEKYRSDELDEAIAIVEEAIQKITQTT
jgi:hypothetical protein